MRDTQDSHVVVLPVDEVARILQETRVAWLAEPAQQEARAAFPKWWNGDKKARTMKSRWRTVLQKQFGGQLWFQVIAATGTIPTRMLELANTQLACRALEREAPAAATQRPGGSQHRVSHAKKLRQGAKKLQRAVEDERDRQRFGRAPSDAEIPTWEFRKLEEHAADVKANAIRVSQASGHAYQMDGEQVGEADSGHFAMMMSQFCADYGIDHRTGLRSRNLNSSICG